MRLSLLLLTVPLVLCSCFSTVHTVGDGPHGGEVRVLRTWYAGWGFLALDSFDSREVVGGADSYRVSTRFSVMDGFINLFTGVLGF